MKKNQSVDLLHGPIFKSLSLLAIPIMATYLIQMAYNLVDMLWIGFLGSGAVASVGVSGNFMYLANGLVNMPKIGSPKLYYKNLSSFASSNFDDKYILNNSLNFTITQDDNADLSSPILYNNCANPIVISYKNENLITDHTISNKDSISYDGSLLKDCNIILSNLKCSFSFYIVIENNLGHKYRCPIYLTIPLSNGTSSIYNGSFYYTYNPDYYFYLYT